MRWVKHMTASHDDEKIAELISKFGHAGYGTWWLVVEIVAARLETGGDPSVTYSVNKWSHLLSLRGSHVFKTLMTLVVTHLVTLERTGDDIKVTIPNLLKYRDEYSRKSGHYPDNVRTKEQIQNTDTEADKEPPTPTAPIGAVSNGKSHSRKGKVKRTTDEVRAALGSERLVWWENFWEVFPCHDGMNEGMNAFEIRVKDHELAVQVWKGAKSYRAKCDADPTIKVKFAQGWINSERWLDENNLPAIVPRPQQKSFIDDVQRVIGERIANGEKPW